MTALTANVLVLISCVVSTLNRLKPAIPDRIGYISKSTSEFDSKIASTTTMRSIKLCSKAHCICCRAQRTKQNQKNAHICRVKPHSDSVKIIWRFSFNCFWMCFTVISIDGFLAFPEKKATTATTTTTTRHIWISAIEIFFEMKTRRHKTIQHNICKRYKNKIGTIVDNKIRMYWQLCAETNIIRRTHKIALPQDENCAKRYLCICFCLLVFFPRVVCEVSKSEHTWIVRHSMKFPEKTKPF